MGKGGVGETGLTEFECQSKWEAESIAYYGWGEEMNKGASWQDGEYHSLGRKENSAKSIGIYHNFLVKKLHSKNYIYILSFQSLANI